MMKALFTSATGLGAQQLVLDNTANNLANVNTTGFKRSMLDFQDLIYETRNAPLGVVQVEVAVFAGGQRQSSVLVSFDVKLQQAVAVTTRAVPKGEALGTDNVRFERRPTDSAHTWVTAREGLAGKRAAHPLAAGRPVAAADVEGVEADNPVLIHQ